MKSRTSRISAFIFAAVFACIMLGSLAFTAIGAGHDCHDDDCGICAVMQTCARLLSETGILPVEGFITAAAVFFAAVIILHSAVNDRITTPISLKVKLLI